jgi:hypothetical protein
MSTKIHPADVGRISFYFEKEFAMLGTIILVILILALIGALPAWPYSSGWGYYPSGGAGLLVIILLILLLTGRI